MRKSTIAGSWYPGDRRELSELIESLLQQADVPDEQGRLFGLIAPHAGIQFSGQAAACAYRMVRGRDINRVILIGPQRRTSGHGHQGACLLSYCTSLDNRRRRVERTGS